MCLTYDTTHTGQVHPPLPRNVEHDNSLQVGQWDALTITLQLDALVKVAEVALNHLLAANHTIPHHVARATATLLRVLLPPRVEVQGDLSIKANAKVVVHHTVLHVVLTVTTRHIASAGGHDELGHNTQWCKN